MKTREIQREIDRNFNIKLKSLGMAYSLRKVANQQVWTCQIGRFNSYTDSFIQGEICSLLTDSIQDQFEYLLKIAIKDKKVNYKSKKV